MKAMLKIVFLIMFCFSFGIINAQHEIIPKEGYSTQIGIMVDMLEEVKDLVTEQVRELTLEETDFLFDDQANSIGAILMPYSIYRGLHSG